MKTLFTASLAAVLLLFIGWSLFSDSTESADSGRIGQQVIEKLSQDPVRRFAEKTKVIPVDQAAQEEKEVLQAKESTVEEDNASDSAPEKTLTTQTQGVRQRALLSGGTQQSDQGDMPNEKFVRDLERYQAISYRNYEEILHLANQQVTRKE